MIFSHDQIVQPPKHICCFSFFGPFLKQRTNFLGTTYKLPEILGSLYVRTNLLKFQEACTYTYKLTETSGSLYVRTNLLDVQTYSNIYSAYYTLYLTSSHLALVFLLREFLKSISFIQLAAEERRSSEGDDDDNMEVKLFFGSFDEQKLNKIFVHIFLHSLLTVLCDF